MKLANLILERKGEKECQERFTKVDCFVKTRKFDLIDIIDEVLKLVVSLPNPLADRPRSGSENTLELA